MKKLMDYLVKYCDILILFIDIVIIATLTILTGATIYFLKVDILKAFNMGGTFEITVIINYVFFLIIYIELIRSIMAGYKRREMYIVSIAEVGFVVTVREVLVSIVSKTTTDLILSSLAALSFAIVLWIIYTKILTTKKEAGE